MNSAEGSKGDCDDVDISQETCGTDFIKESEETAETVTLTEDTVESHDKDLNDDEEEEEKEEEEDRDEDKEEEEYNDDSYPPLSQNVHRL